MTTPHSTADEQHSAQNIRKQCLESLLSRKIALAYFGYLVLSPEAQCIALWGCPYSYPVKDCPPAP